MHELGIATNIVESVRAEMARRGIARVTTIALRIGRLTDVDAEALRFGFEVITRDTALNGACLMIEHIPIEAHCQTCEADFSVEEYLFVCPLCGDSKVTVTHGTELDIAYLEIDDETEAPIAPQQAP